jgi:peptide deformylase
MQIKNKLTSPTKDWVFDDLDYAETFATELLNSIKDTPYYGVAANECGSDFRVIALKSYPESYVCFNPRIVFKSDETSVLEENSPAFKGITCRVRRSTEIRIRFQGPDGISYSKTFTGLSARIVQQVVDTLDSIPFYQSANRFHRDKALKSKLGYSRVGLSNKF